MDGNNRRHARSASFSAPSGTEIMPRANDTTMSQTERRSRMERYTDMQGTEWQSAARNSMPANRTAPMTTGQQPTGQQPNAYGRNPTASQNPYITGQQANVYRRNPTGRQDPYVTGQQQNVRGGNPTASQDPYVTGQQQAYSTQPTGYTVPQNTGNVQRPMRRAANGRPISEWQKNVPNPPMTIRRDLTEDGEDPLLASTRSPEVYNRTGKFWGENGQTAPQGSQRTAANSEMNTGRNPLRNTRANGEIFPDFVPEENEVPTEKGRTNPLLTIAIFIGSVIVIWFILRFTLFRVGKITVTGTQAYSPEYVAQLSGVHIGDNMMSLNEESIRNGIANEVHLKFAYLEKKIPGEVIIAVAEREPAAYMNYCGISYVTDKSGMVLEENEDPEYRPEGLTEVKGLKIRTSFTTGQTLPLVTEEQAEVFRSLFLEIRVIGCNSLIREVDLSKTDAVYLLTSDDISVAMGSNINFHAKLRSMMIVREEIIGRGYTSGTIDVTDPEHPAYIPPAL